MSSKKRKGRGKAAPGTFVGCLRHFLTPALFRQAHQAHDGHKPRRDCRWGLHALVLTLAVFTWAAGDSQEERFEAARAFYVGALAPKRKRPGETIEGFRAALARLPMSVLRLFAAGLRRALLLKLGPWLRDSGFIPIGCDGSPLACPRTAELERGLGSGNKEGTPQLWVTAAVHLSTGLPWSWQLGRADAGEREHLRRLLPTLPPGALVVADAGYYGAELARAILDSGADFLIRMSSKSTLYAEVVPSEGWTDGLVMLWTTRDQDGKRLPLMLRLIRIHEPRRKVDVWLLTSVLQPGRLSLEQASRFYRMRWENEGFFRTFKRTLKQVKLTSRTVRLIHREAEGALQAVQLLLSQGVCARAALASKDVRCSPRGVLLEVRREVREYHKKRGRKGYRQRLGKAGREDRPQRHSAKVKGSGPSGAITSRPSHRNSARSQTTS
jgi:hypothetical protein